MDRSQNIKDKQKVWLTVITVTLLFCAVFVIVLYPNPQPLDEQLTTFGKIADSDDLWHQGVLQHGTGAHEEALTLYTQAIDTHPESKMAYLYRGTLHYDNARYTEAINDYTQALAIDPEFTWALNARGVANYRTGNSDAAQADFKHSQTLDPTFIGPAINQAVIEKLDGNLDEALMLLTRADEFSLATIPTLKVLENIADIYSTQGNTDKAISTYTDIIKHYPNYVIAYHERATLYRAQGKDTEATADEERYTTLTQGDLSHEL